MQSTRDGVVQHKTTSAGNETKKDHALALNDRLSDTQMTNVEPIWTLCHALLLHSQRLHLAMR